MTGSTHSPRRTPRSHLLVTSRNELTGLHAAEGARRLALDTLSTGEARDLLAGRVGTNAVAAEPAAVDAIITACARLPPALSIAAAHAAGDAPRLAMLADELHDSRLLLDTLSTGDAATTDVRAVFAWSYQHLSPPAARLFRLLGLHAGPDISPAAAASLAGISPALVRRLLAELVRAHVISEYQPGRYALHDLLRAYAAELVGHDATDDDAPRATRRLLDHYLHTSYQAALSLSCQRGRICLAPAEPGTMTETATDEVQATAWFRDERQVLLAAAEQAAVRGFDTYAWQLAWTMWEYLTRQGHWHELEALQRRAVQAAGRLGDPVALAHTWRDLAGPLIRLGRYDEADAALAQGLDRFDRLADQGGQARTHTGLCWLRSLEGRHQEALEHAERSLELYRVAGDLVGQAQALNFIGSTHAMLGDHHEAVTHCQHALTLFRQTSDKVGLASTLDSLGTIHHRHGDHTSAVKAYQQAVELRRKTRNRVGEATTLIQLGDVHWARCDVVDARAAWLEALRVLDGLDHPDVAAVRTRLSRPDR